jgi:hypothetical protein
MPPHQLPVSRRRAPGTNHIEFACGNYCNSRRATHFVVSRKTQNVFRRTFLLTLFLLFPTFQSHAQTAGELQNHSAKHAKTLNTWPRQEVRGPHAMVATDEVLGSQAGIVSLVTTLVILASAMPTLQSVMHSLGI